MPGGMNNRVRIWRIDYDSDDVVGGAMPTGTVAHSNVHARVEANPEDQLLLQQGLETVRTFNALIVPGSLDVRERDELEIYRPVYHPYYGVRFRIVGIQYSSMDKYNPNNYMRLSMIRSVRSHAVQ
jgi:hypothetical protein